MPGSTLGEIESAVEIDRQHLAPFLGRRLGGLVVGEDARIVDQDVDRARSRASILRTAVAACSTSETSSAMACAPAPEPGCDPARASRRRHRPAPPRCRRREAFATAEAHRRRPHLSPAPPCDACRSPRFLLESRSLGAAAAAEIAAHARIGDERREIRRCVTRPPSTNTKRSQISRRISR